MCYTFIQMLRISSRDAFYVGWQKENAMLLCFLLPFLYSLLLGCAWSAVFHKKFSSSLAPAFLTHILIVFLSGLIFGRLLIGIYGGIALAVIGILWAAYQNRGACSPTDSFRKLWDNGLFLFTLFYVFCFVTNCYKRFLWWDEYMHWGMFLKESLHLDTFYCASPLQFAHKDYVPALTLFETIWCRLCGGFSEPDAYRSMQIFMFSLLMPMFERFSRTQEIDRRAAGNSMIKNRLAEMSAAAFVLLIPLVFQTANGFMFYHSIYCDIPVGVVFFYSVFEAYRNHESMWYQSLLLTLSLSVMVLTKMTSMALMPLVLGFFAFKLLIASDRPVRRETFTCFIPQLLIPVSLWYAFNRYVDRFVDSTGDIQSYDGMKLSSVAEVFSDPAKSSIPYLGQVRELYIDRLLSEDVLLRGSYIVVLTVVVLAFVLLALLTGPGTQRRRLMWTGIWTLGSGILYAVLMYFLYATAFSEREALMLASFDRYMNSFLISVILLLTAAFYESELWKKHKRTFFVILLIFFLDLSLLHRNAFEQMLPGNLSHDEEKIAFYTEAASIINDTTPENARIYLLRRADNGSVMWRLRYLCSPRTIDWDSVGPPVTDFDVWSTDLSAGEFAERLKDYDYIFFFGVDDMFMEKYAGVFDNLPPEPDEKIFKLSSTESTLHLE